MTSSTKFKPAITLTQALIEPGLFGGTFAAPSFWTWRTVGKILDGIPLREQREIDLFHECTGRTKLPTKPVHNVIILAGRRAGKDRFLSSVAVWRSALCTNWRKYQSAGEGAVVLLLGADKKQATILRRYCEGLLAVPLLAREVKRRAGDVLEFKNGASLEIATNDVRLVRGRSAIAVLGTLIGERTSTPLRATKRSLAPRRRRWQWRPTKASCCSARASIASAAICGASTKNCLATTTPAIWFGSRHQRR